MDFWSLKSVRFWIVPLTYWCMVAPHSSLTQLVHHSHRTRLHTPVHRPHSPLQSLYSPVHHRRRNPVHRHNAPNRHSIPGSKQKSSIKKLMLDHTNGILKINKNVLSNFSGKYNILNKIHDF